MFTQQINPQMKTNKIKVITMHPPKQCIPFIKKGKLDIYVYLHKLMMTDLFEENDIGMLQCSVVHNFPLHMFTYLHHQANEMD